MHVDEWMQQPIISVKPLDSAQHFGLAEGPFFAFLNGHDQKRLLLEPLDDLLYRFVYLLAVLEASTRSAQTLA